MTTPPDQLAAVVDGETKQTWGQAYLDRLATSDLWDTARLRRAKTFLRKGDHANFDFGLGVITATVIGERDERYQCDVMVKALPIGDFEEVAKAISAQSRHAAALLDGELPEEILEFAREIDIDLIPPPADVRFDCTCPDWSDPCKHAIALWHLGANAIDADPFNIFKLRGISKADFLDLLRSFRTSSLDAAPHHTAGVNAHDAFESAEWHPGSPIPDELAQSIRDTIPKTPYHPYPFELSAGAIRKIDIDALRHAQEDATLRANDMSRDGAPAYLDLTPRADLARFASQFESNRSVVELALSCGLVGPHLVAWVRAWEVGGAGAVSVVSDEGAWVEDQDRLAAGRDRLVEAGMEKRSISLNYDSLRMKDNHWLVIGTDLRWYHLVGPGKRLELHIEIPPAEDILDIVDIG